MTSRVAEYLERVAKIAPVIRGHADRSESESERCWRDVHTMTQHVILGAGRLETVGRIMLGLDPNSPII